MKEDIVKDAFRQAVLVALDQVAREIFNPPRNDAGATDQDLPRLFAAIDRQVEELAKRYHVTFMEE